VDNYLAALNGTAMGVASSAPVGRMMAVSLVSALVIAIGKIAISLLSAFAIVYFRFPLRNVVFWMIFITLMLPVEVRIGPTYEVVADLGLLNSYAGLTVPLIASATATFLFRQFFLTVPDELVEARASTAPGRCASSGCAAAAVGPSIAALFVIQFIYGWNQYLWPLLVTTDESMYTGGHRHQAHDPTSPTASSSCSSAPRAAARARCCAWWPGWRSITGGEIRSATRSSTTWSPRTATSRWCSRTTRSTRT
jgi:ABC-type maltose transport system permease subunit